MLKVIIAGGRDFDNFKVSDRIIGDLLDNCPGKIELVSGMAKGADEAPYLFNLSYGKFYGHKLIAIKPFEPDWSLGRVAGMLRNRDMALYADCLIAFWDGESRGTKNMIETMWEMNKPAIVYGYDGTKIS